MGVAIPRPCSAVNDSASGAQVIDGSLKFDSSSSQYLTRTPGSAGNRRTWTYSAWIKRGNLASSEGIFSTLASGHPTTALKFGSSHVLEFLDYQSGYICQKITNQVFRDTGWYHIVVAIDTTLSTEEDRFKLYVNGERVTSFSTNTNFSTQNQQTDWNSVTEHNLFTHGSGFGSHPYDGMGAQIYFIDGFALDPTSFAEPDATTGQWVPKEYGGTFNAAQDGLGGVTWSSYVSGPVNGSKPLSNCFGGTIGTGYAAGTTPTSGNTLTLDISALNLTVTNVRLNSFLAVTLGSPSTFTVNGSTVTTNISNGDQTHVIAVNGQLNTIAWSYDSGNGPYVYMRGIEVDLGDGEGYQLLTDGAGAPAGVNGFHLAMDPAETGTIYSDDVTASGGFHASGPAVHMFDGNLTTAADAYPQTGGVLTWTPSSPIDYEDKVEVYHASSSTNYWSVNGGTAISVGSQSAWVTLVSGSSGSITSISNTSTTSWNNWRGVRIDGKILVDHTAFGHDSSGQKNHWHENNLVATSSVWPCVSFDGSGDYLEVTSSSDLNLSGDFTLEFYYNITGAPTGVMMFTNTSASNAGTYSTETCIYYTVSNGLFTFAADSVLIVTATVAANDRLNTWNHIAVTRSGSTTRMFINGNLESTSTTVWTAQTGNNWYIGDRPPNAVSAQYPLTGLISNYRIIKGTALYTAAFIPPTAPLTNVTGTTLLCCQSSTQPGSATVAPDAGTGTALLNAPLSSTPFADSSSTSATITNTGSIAAASAGTNSFDITNAASLDGSSQRLSTNNTNLTFTGTWTFDAWFKLDSSASGYNALFNTGYGSGTSDYMYFSINDDEKPYVEGGSAGSSTTASDAINKNQWYHMRVRSDGASIKQYIDGELVVTHGVNTIDMSSKGTKTIGSLVDSGNNANNFHGLVGPVRYVSSDLGPPVAGGESTSSVAFFNGNVYVGTAITMYASSGIVSATSFYGDGQYLDNVSASGGGETDITSCLFI